jgi:hypothetical protein
MTRARTFWLAMIVVLCGVSLWLGRRPTPAANVAANAGPARTDAAFWADTPGREPVHLVVLNGSGVGGLAREVSLELAVAGCVVERVANAPHDHFARTLLINRTLAGEHARILATLLGGVPVLREWNGRGAEDAVLVLGIDHAEVRAALRRSTAPAD